MIIIIYDINNNNNDKKNKQNKGKKEEKKMNYIFIELYLIIILPKYLFRITNIFYFIHI